MGRGLFAFYGLRSLLAAFILLSVCACTNHKRVGEKEVVEKPVDIDAAAAGIIEATINDELETATHSKNFSIYNPAIVQYFYDKVDYRPVWSKDGVFSTAADSLLTFIDASRSFGLYPADYKAARLHQLFLQVADTSKENKLDAAKWAESDLLLTAAYINIVKDVKIGRLVHDSISKKDTTLTPEFYFQQWNGYGGSMHRLALQMEPGQPRYHALKEALTFFLRNATFKDFLPVDAADTVHLQAQLAVRLAQEDSITFNTPTPDSATLSAAIKKYQSLHDLKTTGKFTPALAAALNNTDNDRFARIAVTLDRYKLLQALPPQYIWVNIPAYKLELWDSGFVVLTSKVVVGKPETRTPQLTSAISDIVTYPKWHIPESIIKKDILPALKRDPGYLARKGFSLVDNAGTEVDPYSVTWAKYETGIPYTVVQGSGDDNALGVLKFNFPNPYAVYLHDTNQRYLFSKQKRALSHGCVRVEAWEELATYILERDNAANAHAVPLDSMYTWLMLKQKHYIPVHKRLPVFIRYFACDVGGDGNVVFYDDIYGEDKRLINQFFKSK